MKISFILLTNQKDLKKYFSVTGIGMVPKEIREKHGADHKFFTKPPHLDDLTYCLKINRENPDSAIAILSDSEYRSNIFDLEVPTSILQARERNIKTELSRVITFWIKRLNSLEQTFKPMGNRKALLLPFPNFKDTTAQQLWSSINKNLGERTFSLIVEIEKLVSHLRDKEFPKKKGGYRDKYFVDERGYHFQYGHERHSRPVVEGNGHTAKCAFNSQLRFGLPYDFERHYNLSLEDNRNLKGRQFVNCHNQTHTAESCDHLNIFPNSFIN
ncbi:hypothetical protein [Roseibium aggregatum]|uniref:Uncharacterized protein n=1 Tax=Roseibium aggregatum TaxID=187304 RepID=A0A939EGU6_9HYPH|nr:hypothetical protein [Roseibium aggregatum]MBN9671500.1 hypothetical protein [Roseibium aggregatum]